MLKTSTVIASVVLPLALSAPALADHGHHRHHAGWHRHSAEYAGPSSRHRHVVRAGVSRRAAEGPVVAAPGPGIVDDGLGIGLGLADTGLGIGADAVGTGLDIADLGIGIGTGAADAGLGLVDPYPYRRYPAGGGVPLDDDLL